MAAILALPDILDHVGDVFLLRILPHRVSDWFPTYLSENRGFKLKQMGLYASLPLFVRDHRRSLRRVVLGSVVKTYRRSPDGAAGRRARQDSDSRVRILPAALTDDPYMSVCSAASLFLGLELTVGVTWAVPLDIGAEYAGSVSAVMNTCGNIGGAVSPAIIGLYRAHYGLEPAISCGASCVWSRLCCYFEIDATRQVAFAEPS